MLMRRATGIEMAAQRQQTKLVRAVEQVFVGELCGLSHHGNWILHCPEASVAVVSRMHPLRSARSALTHAAPSLASSFEFHPPSWLNLLSPHLLRGTLCLCGLLAQ